MHPQDGNLPSLIYDNRLLTCLLPKYLKTELQTKFLQIYLDQEQIIYDLSYYNSMIKSENTFDIFIGLVKMRRALSLTYEEEYQQFINNIIEQNMIAPIIHIINSSSNELILYESLWIITILTSGSSDIIKLVLQNGLLQCLLKKFNLENYHNLLIEFVCWIYGNIAADDIQFSDQLIEMNTLKLIIEFAQQKIQVEYNQKNNQIKTITWAIRNYRNFIPNQYFMPVLQIFSKWIHLSLGFQTLTWICQTFLSFLKHPNCLQNLIDLGVVPRLVLLIGCDNLNLALPNFYIIEKILENQNYLGYLIGLGIIPSFEKLLNKRYTQNFIKRILSALNLISNATIELRKQLLNSQVIKQLIKLSRSSQFLDDECLKQIFGNIVEILETSTFKDKKLTTCLKLCEHVVVKFDKSNERFKTQLDIIQNFCNKLRHDSKQSQFLDKQQEELIQRILTNIKIIENYQ